VKTPHWDLAEVKRLATQRDGLWVQVGRALVLFADAQAAKDAVKRALSGLTVRRFVKTVQQTWDIVDVYALKREDGAGWMMKLYIDQGAQVNVISFHPLERPIKTNGGWVKP
jgi:hypothetical protein